MKVRLKTMPGEVFDAHLVRRPSFVSREGDEVVLEVRAQAPLHFEPPAQHLWELVTATADELSALQETGFHVPQAQTQSMPVVDQVLRQYDVCPHGQRLTMLVPGRLSGWHDLGLDLRLVAGRPLRFALNARLLFSKPPTRPEQEYLRCDLRFVPARGIGRWFAKPWPILADLPMYLPAKPGALQVRWNLGEECADGLMQVIAVCDSAVDMTRLMIRDRALFDRVLLSSTEVPTPLPAADFAHKLLAERRASERISH